MEKKRRYNAVMPTRGEDFINEVTNEKIRFLLYTVSDIEIFEECIKDIDEQRLFQDINIFKKGKEKIFNVGTQEFEYTKDFLGMGQCFILTDETSTWDHDYNN